MSLIESDLDEESPASGNNPVPSLPVDGPINAPHLAENGEALYQVLFEEAAHGIILTDAAGQIAQVNDSGCRMLGYGPSELLATPVQRLVEGDWASSPLNSQLLYDVTQRVSKCTLLRKDGRRLHAKVRGTLLSDGRVLAVVHDLKPQRRAPRNAQTSAIENQILFQTSHSVMLLIEPDTGQIVEANPAACAFYGYNRAELLSKDITDINQLPPPRVGEEMQRARQGEQSHFRFRHCLASGETREVEVYSSPVQLQGRTLLYSVVHDVTERIQVERAWAQLHELLQSTLASLNDAVFIVNPLTRQIVDCNTTAQTIFGYTREEIVGRDTCFLHVDEEAFRAFGEAIQAAYSLDGYFEMEWLMRRKSGEIFPTEHYARPVRTLDDVPLQVNILRDITGRRQAEAQLHLKTTALEAASNAIVITNRLGIIQWVNDAFTTLTGYMSDEVVGQTPRLLKSDLQDPAFYAELWETLLSGQVWRGELINRRRNGTLYTEEQVITPVCLGSEVTHFIAVKQDITARKEAEAQLKLQAHLLDAVDQAVIATDLDGSIIYWGRFAASLYGWTASEVMGRNILDVTPASSDRERAAENLATLRRGERWSGELLLQRRDGTSFPARVTDSPVHDHHGKLVALIDVTHDITRRNQVEAEIRKSETKYRTLFETMSQGVVYHDETGAITAANPAAERILGLTLDQMQGRTSLDPRWRVIHSDGAEFPGETHPANVALRTGEAVTGVTMGVFDPAQERYRWILVSATPQFHDREAQPYQVFATFEDITERQEQLRRFMAIDEIDRAVIGSLDLPNTLDLLLKHVMSLLGVHAAEVLVMEPSSLILRSVAARGFHSRSVRWTTLRTGKGTAGRAALERRMIIIPDLRQANSSVERIHLIEQEGFCSCVAVPLMAKGQVAGVLQVFHRVPFIPDETWLDLLSTLTNQASIAINNLSLFDRLQQSNLELALAYESSIEGWSRALDLRDKETEGHSLRVTDMTLRLAQAVGVHDTELIHIRRGALLHDIGKMGIPDHVLHKPGPLSEQEWALMRQHPTLAHELLSPIRFLQPALDIPYAHHEKWDGSGYPRGLKGEKIPLAARIFALVDVWDALRSERPYRKSWSEEAIRVYLQEQAGTHFDPTIVPVFLRILEQSPDAAVENGNTMGFVDAGDDKAGDTAL